MSAELGGGDLKVTNEGVGPAGNSTVEDIATRLGEARSLRYSSLIVPHDQKNTPKHLLTRYRDSSTQYIQKIYLLCKSSTAWGRRFPRIEIELGLALPALVIPEAQVNSPMHIREELMVNGRQKLVVKDQLLAVTEGPGKQTNVVVDRAQIIEKAMSTAKEQAGLSVRLRIRYHKQKPGYSAFDPDGPPINTNKVQREISRLGLPYCRKDAIEVPRFGQVQCEWYFEKDSKIPQTMAYKLRPESDSVRPKEIDDWMQEFYIFGFTATCKERGCPPKLIVNHPEDPYFGGDLEMFPIIRGPKRFVKHPPEYPASTRPWGVKPTYDEYPKLGRYSLSSITQPFSNEHRRSRSLSSIASTPPHSRSPATTLVDHESSSSLVPPPTSSTLVGDSSVDGSWPTSYPKHANCSPQHKRGREEDDCVMRKHSLPSASKRSRWDVAPTGNLLERFRSRSTSPSPKHRSNYLSSGPRSMVNNVLRKSGHGEDFAINPHQYRSSSISHYNLPKSHPERRNSEDIARWPRRRPSPSPPTVRSPKLYGAFSPQVHSSQRISEQSVANVTARKLGINSNEAPATTSSATISPSSLLPIGPVDLTEFLTAFSTATASVVPSSYPSDSLPISSNHDASSDPTSSALSSAPNQGSSSSTISMSDLNSLLKAFPAVSSHPATQEQATEMLSAKGAGESTLSQTYAPASSSMGTYIAPAQLSHGQYGYRYPPVNSNSYQYPYPYTYQPPHDGSYTQSSSLMPVTAVPVTPVLTTGVPIPRFDSGGNVNESRIKEESVDSFINAMNIHHAQGEIEASSFVNPGVARIVQLRSELHSLRNEIRERGKKEKIVLAELAELAEKLKTEFVLGEVDGSGLEGFGIGSELGLGLRDDDKIMERPSSSEIETELRSNLLIMQAQLTSERNIRRKVDQERRDAESAKREAEHALKEAEQRLSDVEQLMSEAEQGRKDAEYALSEVENAQKEVQFSLKEAVERRREAEQLRRDAEHAKIMADDRRKDAEQGRKDAEHDKRKADDRRRDAEQARRDAEHAKRRAEADKRDADDCRRAVEHGLHDAESAKLEIEQRWKEAELARKEAEERRREADAFVADVKRECREPFVVPALMDVFRNVSKVTTQTTVAANEKTF
ncbi:hypothetical protein EV368DRAFT_63012 [Lentinula lateritia]|nr:hypothetical protein EV368DRAFT_63012 [Lentinula lateritia]